MAYIDTLTIDDSDYNIVSSPTETTVTVDFDASSTKDNTNLIYKSFGYLFDNAKYWYKSAFIRLIVQGDLTSNYGGISRTNLLLLNSIPHLTIYWIATITGEDDTTTDFTLFNSTYANLKCESIIFPEKLIFTNANVYIKATPKVLKFYGTLTSCTNSTIDITIYNPENHTATGTANSGCIQNVVNLTLPYGTASSTTATLNLTIGSSTMNYEAGVIAFINSASATTNANITELSYCNNSTAIIGKRVAIETTDTATGTIIDAST